MGLIILWNVLLRTKAWNYISKRILYWHNVEPGMMSGKALYGYELLKDIECVCYNNCRVAMPFLMAASATALATSLCTFSLKTPGII